MSLGIGRRDTFEVGGLQGFEVGGFDCVEGCCTNEDLFNGIPRLPEMEHEELHQA